MSRSSFDEPLLEGVTSRSSQTQVFCSECPYAFMSQVCLHERRTKRSHGYNNRQMLGNGRIPSATSCQPITTSVTSQKQDDTEETTQSYSHQQLSKTSTQLGEQLKKQQLTCTGKDTHICKPCDESLTSGDLNIRQHVRTGKKTLHCKQFNKLG